MKKLVIKIFALIAFLAIVTGTTIAYLSDAEVSDNNPFVAGSIDLKIDSDCSYNGQPCDGFGTWSLTDLTTEKFFNFHDLEIGDYGEDTISYHVYENDAYGCFSIDTDVAEDCNCQSKSATTTSPETTSTTGVGQCAVNDGYPTECVHKIEWEDSDTTKTYTTTDGSIIEVVYIKAGTDCIKYISDITTGDYSVTGIGTTSVTVIENFSKDGETKCPKDVSHTEYVVCKDLISYLYFFGWYDDGDNIFEPGCPEFETVIFGPILATEFLDPETFELAEGVIPANTTGYIGMAWCVGDMSIDLGTGEITCTEPDIPCLCDGPENNTVCLDIEFYVEQARHNINFTCDSP